MKPAKPAFRNKTLSVAILSGKGGVGKTNLALNLGYALYKAGHPLLLMDCDLGLANLDVLLGIAPEKNLQDLLKPEVSPKEVFVPIEENGFDLLPATSGVPEMLEMDDDMRDFLFRKLYRHFVHYDYLLLDIGAGISPTVLSFACMARDRIVIVTPEPTSLTDGYALIKVLYTQRKVSRFLIVCNQVRTREEGLRTFERLHAACEKFLGLPITYLGSIRQDKSVIESVMRQIPLLRYNPKGKAGQDILTLAIKLHRRRQALLPEIKTLPALTGFRLPKK